MEIGCGNLRSKDKETMPRTSEGQKGQRPESAKKPGSASGLQFLQKKIRLSGFAGA